MSPEWSVRRGRREAVLVVTENTARPDICAAYLGVQDASEAYHSVGLTPDDARSLAAALTSWANKVSQVSTQDASAERAGGCAPAHPARSPSKRPWITVPGAVVAEQAVPGVHAIRAQQPAKCRLPACENVAVAGRHGFCCWAHCDRFADLKAETADQT